MKDNLTRDDVDLYQTQVAALEELLDTYEKTAVEQADKLYQEISERKKAEDALRASEANFRGLLESAPDGMVIVNADHEILMINEQFERMFGYGREEVLGSRIELLVPPRFSHHPEHGRAFINAPKRRIMGRGLELFALCKDGSEVPVEISLSPLDTPEGLVVSAAIRDITERKLAEQKLRESEEKLRNITDMAQDAVIMLEDNGNIRFWNKAAERIFGYEAGETLGRPAHSLLIPPRFQEDHLQAFDRFKATGQGSLIGKTIELPALKKDGAEIPIELSISSVKIKDQWCAIGIARDITERKMAEAELAQQSKSLKRLNTELQALYKVSRAMSRNIDMDRLLTEVLQTLSETDIFPFEVKGAIFLVEGGKLQLASFVNLAQEGLDPWEPCGADDPADCLCGIVLETGEPVISHNSHEDKRHAPCGRDGSPHGHIIIPLKAQAGVVGVLTLYTEPGAAIGDHLLKLLSSIGSQIGIAISNAKLYAETKSSSLHDPLTGLANRRLMDIQMKKSIESSKRYGEEFAVIMLDIDHFKRYNDTYGHPAGDGLLVQIADILVKEVRKADFIFRYGGEEFLVMLPRAGWEMARDTAERLRAAVSSGAGVTISLGVAALSCALQEQNALIAAADKALYAAKEKGRNRVEVSPESTNS